MKRIISVILVIAVILPCFCINAGADAVSLLNLRYEQRMELVTELLMNDKKTLEKIDGLGNNIIFVSVSDTMNKAVTVYASSKSLDKALEKALKKAQATNISPVWFKLDIVTAVEEIRYEDFKKKCAYMGEINLDYTLREGIAFNSYFGRALLEAQINSNGMLSYETGELDLEKINAHFKENRKKQLSEIPEKLYLFKTQGYFADTGAKAYKLTSGTYANNGTRRYEMDLKDVKNLAKKSSRYLADMVDENGKFVYGYYPIDNEELEGYNIIRHAGTTWNLILQYEMTGDKALIEPIERALSYLTEYMHYKDSKTAFLNDRGTLNVGGNGISLLAYVSYAEIMKSDKFNGLIEALANGIMYLQKEDGSYIHTLNKYDYSVYMDYITVFYDGEATYGILKAYGLLGKEEYLKTAEKAADYFIENNYEELHSHWISYSFNELTKYSPKPEYFSFGLRNVHGYTDEANRTVVTSPTTGETIGAAFELYDRMIKSGIECEIPDGFDSELLIEAFEMRINWGMHYFVQPEQAMYFNKPRLVLNSFVIREDKFRIRIDDIQHFMGGYYLYYKNYEILQEYVNQ